MSQILQKIVTAASGASTFVNGTTTPDLVKNGVPYMSDGAVAVDTTGAITHYHQGLPFTTEGRLAADSSGAPTRIGNGGAPFTATGRLSIAAGEEASHYSAGIAYTAASSVIFVGTAPPTAPVITLQPVVQNINQWDTLTLSSTATGAVSQQWYLDGSAIAGATSATYSKADSQVADDGNYFCRYTNATGSTDTSTVAANVTAVTPIVTTQPTAQSIAVGATLTLVAAADGATSQQWYLGGVAVSGATSATYSKSNAQLADSGNYFCRFTNATGTTDTSTVAGTVTAAAGTLTFNGTNQYGTI
jgi:hypothetical protein